MVHILGEDGSSDITLKHVMRAGESVDVSDIVYTVRVDSYPALTPAQRETGCRLPPNPIGATPVVFEAGNTAAWASDGWTRESSVQVSISELLGGEASELFEQPGVYLFIVYS